MSLEESVKEFLNKETDEGKAHHQFFTSKGFTRLKGKGVFHPMSFHKSHKNEDEVKATKEDIHKHLEGRGYKKAARTFAYDVYRHPHTKKVVTVSNDNRNHSVSVEADK